jgi:hypothetical protein
MAPSPRSAPPASLKLVEPTPQSADFTDPEGQRALSAAALSVARQLGRQAAREHFAALLDKARCLT